MADSCCSSKSSELETLAMRKEQRHVLVVVLVINAVMFFVEFGAGILAGSAALMADATDMFGDALVYAISLYAIGRSNQWKAGVAVFKGLFIAALALGILGNVIAKLINGVPPSSTLMLIFGAIALVANLACLSLLWRFRGLDVNMSSTFECSRNDVISNVGVLIAAGLVALFQSPWPDIAIGGLMGLIILRSAFRILADAWPQWSPAKR